MRCSAAQNSSPPPSNSGKSILPSSILTMTMKDTMASILPPPPSVVHLGAPLLEIIPSIGAQPPEITPIDRSVHDVVRSVQARNWRGSKEYQHLVRVLLELKGRPICPVLAAHVPSFLMSSTDEVLADLLAATAERARSDLARGQRIEDSVASGQRLYWDLWPNEAELLGLFHTGRLFRAMKAANEACGHGIGMPEALSI